MSQFSAVDAATEGFRLIGRKPGVVAVWVLVWLVLAFGPVIAMAGVMLPHVTGMISQLHDLEDSGPEAFARVMQFQAALWSMLAPWLLWMFIAQTVLYAAIFRAVLEPANSGLAYLRLGMDEVRLFLLQIILFILWIAFLCAITLAAVAVFFAARPAGEQAAPWIDVLAALALVALCFYVPVRLSLAGPMTFARKRLDVFGSWGRTRGRFWSLVLMLLVIICFVAVIGIVAGVLRTGLVLGLGWSDLQHFDQLGDDPRVVIPAVMKAMGPGLIAAIVVQAIADALIRIVAAAPFAAAYRQLSGGAATEPMLGASPAHA